MRHPRQALFLYSGIAAGLVVAAGVVFVSLLKPHVNPITDSISMLGKGPVGYWLRGAFVLGGLLTLLFASVVGRVFSHSRVLGVAQWAMGIGLIATGLFIEEAPPTPSQRILTPLGALNRAGLAHALASALMYTATVASAWLVWVLLRKTGGPDNRRFALLASILLTGLIPTFVVYMASTHGPSGLFERLAATMAIAFELWLSAVSVKRTRSPRNP